MAWIGRILVILLVFLFAIPTLGIILVFVPVGLWISAIFAGVPVSLQILIGMRLRKVNPHRIVEPLISATKAGLNLDINEMEAHYLAGGDVGRVVSAMISADKAAIDLNWQRAMVGDQRVRTAEIVQLSALAPGASPTCTNALGVKTCSQELVSAFTTVRFRDLENLLRYFISIS